MFSKLVVCACDHQLWKIKIHTKIKESPPPPKKLKMYLFTNKQMEQVFCVAWSPTLASLLLKHYMWCHPFPTHWCIQHNSWEFPTGWRAHRVDSAFSWKTFQFTRHADVVTDTMPSSRGMHRVGSAHFSCECPGSSIDQRRLNWNVKSVQEFKGVVRHRSTRSGCSWEWRMCVLRAVGPEVQGTCSCRGPAFCFKNPCGDSQPSFTPVPGTLISSSVLQGHQAWHVVRIHLHIQNTHRHKIK